MKRFIIAAAVCTVIMGCEKNTGKEEDSVDIPLTITVSDNGFSMEDGTYSNNRAFSAGDRIGLFALMNGEILEGFNNICLTASGTGDAIVWQAADPEMLFPSGAEYYAYWPYQETLPASVDLTASDAAGFFSMISEAWPVASDQSGDGFDSSDLLIGMAAPADNSLSLGMSHAMGLVEISLPGTFYTFTNTDYDIPDYSLSGLRISFDSKIPKSKNGRLLLVVEPGVFSIPCTYSGESKTYDGNAEAGKCTSFSEGDPTVIEHNLQIGDFFLADGNLLSKDAPASKVGSANVIGLVCQIDPERIGNGEKEALGGTAHALVLATRGAGYGGYYSWYNDYSTGNFERDESEIGFTSIPELTDPQELYSLAIADIEGYANYHLLITERAADVAAGNYRGFHAITLFKNEVGGPAEGMTTGWFMPAGGQLLDAISNLTGLQFDESNVQASSAVGGWDGCLSWMEMGTVASLMNSAMEKVSFTNKIPFADAGNGIQIAAQSSPTNYRYIDFADGGWIEYLHYHKNKGVAVRAMLAF